MKALKGKYATPGVLLTGADRVGVGGRGRATGGFGLRDAGNSLNGAKVEGRSSGCRCCKIVPTTLRIQ